MTNKLNTETKIDGDVIQPLIIKLKNKDGMVRRHAREAIEAAGRSATPYLIEALDSLNKNARWEAAKALVNIKDPLAGPALVRALMDESYEVQWLAAEALIALGHDALVPLLEGLINDYGSIDLRRGAHHVLHDLERQHKLNHSTLYVLDELRATEPLEPYPVSIRRSLDELYHEQKTDMTLPGNK